MGLEPTTLLSRQSALPTVKRVLQNGRKKISQVHSNKDIDLTARRLLLISMVRPTLERCGKVIRLRQQR